MAEGLASIYSVFAFALGAAIASFLNVVIWRVPRGESIVSPPSHCPKCNAAIRWWQNLPILSWLALRGRCANCRAPISPRYILVETLGGVLFLAVFRLLCVVDGKLLFCLLKTPADQAFLAVLLVGWWLWVALMIVGSFIDFDHQLLPDFVTVGGMVLGVVLAVAGGVFTHSWSQLVQSLVGLAFGFGLLWLVRWLGSKAFGREAMGMGDVFLMGAVGALLGPLAVLAVLILSSLYGSVVGVGMILVSKARLGKFVAIPFGPYICLGCLTWMFWGEKILAWYVRLFSAT